MAKAISNLSHQVVEQLSTISGSPLKDLNESTFQLISLQQVVFRLLLCIEHLKKGEKEISKAQIEELVQAQAFLKKQPNAEPLCIEEISICTLNLHPAEELLLEYQSLAQKRTYLADFVKDSLERLDHLFETSRLAEETPNLTHNDWSLSISNILTASLLASSRELDLADLNAAVESKQVHLLQTIKDINAHSNSVMSSFNQLAQEANNEYCAISNGLKASTAQALLQNWSF